ncbi:thioredoxin family protein [Pelotomaculum sp. PtaB.Bin117]|uniref:thioredoxin family protein n=1 Tax=Pelotomaculum sp. PtaB.Bin117 TaxID=1811694 RepID=UPI0009C796EE|nr:thioredoxin family protein [Pelotomaculum sp. PtaB.Bin117]OPX86994.1 MAG: hypothetical protein A4E54_01876 [Pelotomaculum sp. PtaB.Bin117]OPY58725.1 MAG: hypothetical protein A4E56_03349 [Pelotomaculum sp. PtaU1.Bin065]
MDIKILGTGCANCRRLHQLAEEAVAEMGLQAPVEKVEDLRKIMGYGIMKTPAIVINEKVKTSGRVPGKDEIKKFIQDEA